MITPEGRSFKDAVSDNMAMIVRLDASQAEATVLGVLGSGSSDVVSGLGIGKKTSVSNNVIITDIDLHRAPMAGDRLLIWFDATVQNPTGLTTYNNGTAVTSNLENATFLNIGAGWNILEFKNDLLFNNVWVRMQNVPIPNNTLSGLSDTAITSLSDGQLLTYDNETQKWKNKTYVEANTGFPVTELKKLKVGNVVYDTDGMKNYSVTNVASNNITVSVLNSNQFVQEVIAINTGNHTGSSSAWNLVLTDGMNPVSVALKNADGTAFADDIHENELLFVYVDTAGNTARVLEIHSHDLEILKDVIITEKTATGNPLTLTDALPYAALSLSADIVPIQDLHGYDKPWAGGAGKNKLPMTVSSIKAANTSGTWNGNSYTHNGVTYTIQTDSGNNITGFNIGSGATASGESYLNVNASLNDIPNDTYILNGCPSNGADDTYKLMVIKSPSPSYADKGNGITVTKDNTVTLYQARIVIANGYTIPSGGLLFKPMLRLSTVSDASFAPYSNICPISGRDSVEIIRTSHNIWDEQWEVGSISAVDGSDVYAENRIRSKYFPCDGSTTYAFSYATKDHMLFFYDANKNYISNSAWVFGGTFTTPSNARYIRFIMAAGYGTTYGNNIAINYPSTVTTYESYKGINVIIQLGQTVYGGSLNLTTGVLTITHAIVDLGTLDYTFSSGTGRMATVSLSDVIKKVPTNNEVADIKCDIYVKDSANHTATHVIDGSISVDTTGGVVIYDSRYTDATAFKTAMNGIGFEYPLATPQTIQLTPTEVQMLKGYNQISSGGGGDITLTYKADAIAQANMYSTDEIEIGTWLGKKLYRKVVDFGALPNATGKSVNSGLSDITITKIYGIANSSSLSLVLPYIAIGANMATASIEVDYQYANNNILITTGSNRSGYNAYVVLEYTKN
jgi:hypothetical protein